MANSVPDTRDSVLESARIERERIDGELRDIDAKLEQSQGELGRLQERNSKATAGIQQLNSNFDSAPRSAIKEAYEAVQEAQQRLFIMRSQVEKLQVERDSLGRYIGTLDELLAVMVVEDPAASDGAAPDEDGGSKSTAVRIIEAQEAERKRLSKQMHDGPAQSLTNFILQAEICQRLFDRDVDRAREELLNLKSSASTTFQRVREFIFDLRPMSLEDLGLGPTLRSFVGAYADKTGIVAQLEVLGDDSRLLEPYRQIIIFRAIQELLGNVREHAGATEVQVILDMSGDTIKASVDDNGQGFSTGELDEVFSNRQSVGLPVLQERVELVGGELQIDSVSGRGTKITLSIPAD